MTEALPPLEPLYSESHAARILGIKPRSLRNERCAGRISYKRVAGKVMFRHSDLVAWQKKGTPCQEDAQTKGPSSLLSKSRAGGNPSGTSAGTPVAEATGVQRARAIAARLKRSSPDGSSAEPTRSRGRVIPLKSQ